MEHWFWLLLCVLVMTWYVVVTIIVGYKGGKDIKVMIEELKSKETLQQDE